MGKGILITLAVAALSALLGERVVNLRKRSLATRELVKNHLSNCTLLSNLDHGSEDITILNFGVAFISTGPLGEVTKKEMITECYKYEKLKLISRDEIEQQMSNMTFLWDVFKNDTKMKHNECYVEFSKGLKYPGLPNSDAPGLIYFLDLQDPQLKPVELRIQGELDVESFNPHGISAYIDKSDDTVYLFVVNHPLQNSQVEVFTFVESDLTLVHLKTIKHELLYSVNDIVAVDIESFYATNDHYFNNEILKGFVEPLLAQPWTNVVYYSPEEVKVVSDGYYFADGINISPNKNHLYVVDLLDHNVHVMKRNDDASLALVKTVAVGSLCDNVEVDPESGDLWLGCHPNGWKAFMMDPEDPPGSEVIRIQNIDYDEPMVTQVYMDDGHVIKASSVAARHGKHLLIGTAFHKALHCKLD